MERVRKGLRAPERAWGHGTPPWHGACSGQTFIPFSCIFTVLRWFFFPQKRPCSIPTAPGQRCSTWLCGLLHTLWIWGFIQHIPPPDCGMGSYEGLIWGLPIALAAPAKSLLGTNLCARVSSGCRDHPELADNGITSLWKSNSPEQHHSPANLGGWGREVIYTDFICILNHALLLNVRTPYL